MYDIAIIGAGPAGATLARLVGKGYRVLLLDRRRLDSTPDGASVKSCGGLVAPDAQEVLGRMGLALPREVLVGPQIFAVRTLDLQSGQERYYQRFYINIDRERFDRWLVALVPAGVDVRMGCLFHAYTREDDGYALNLSAGGRRFTERARILIGADGAASRLRIATFPRAPLKRYAAIQEWFEVPAAPPYFSAIFDPEVTDFYAWTIPKEGLLLLGAALQPGETAPARFTLLKDQLRHRGFDLSRPIRREGAWVLRPQAVSLPVAAAPGLALIGEAAGFISPSSAEGFSYAFRSALAAAGSLRPGLDGFTQRYQRSVGPLRRNLLLKRLKAPFMYNPMLRRLVLATGLASLDVLHEHDAAPALAAGTDGPPGQASRGG
ncbi:MAG: FAD-binding protein [Bacillota bacterium]